jgi:hemerythrin-like metal-binding protein
MPKKVNEIEIIPWSTSYEISHELIDSQHKIFLMLLNKLTVTIANGVTKEHMFRVLNEVKKYAEFHFLSEENVMHECFYPGIYHHKRIHSEILFEFSVLSERVSQGRAQPSDVVVFLKSWLFDHILNEDIHVASYVKVHSYEILPNTDKT